MNWKKIGGMAVSSMQVGTTPHPYFAEPHLPCPVAGEAHHLPGPGEEAGVEVEPGEAQLAAFDAAVVGFSV